MNTKSYKVEPQKKVNLKDFSTTYDGDLTKEEVYETLLPKNLRKMAEYQEKFYAENQRGLLIVLQAMDAAGKDGIIKHVFTALNPQGTQVTSFKQPSSEELDHDYLWRIAKALPARGNIGIFNRSHYEDVLVTRVHNLLPLQQIPQSLVSDDIWEQRFKEISSFEKYLGNNGIKVVKFFLHVSKDEQKERLLERIDREDKNWKFSSSDISEREYWDEYQKAYEDLLENTSTKEAPWYVIPADKKWFGRYLISEIVLEIMEELDPQFPELPKGEKEQLSKWREILLGDEKDEEEKEKSKG
ncbi:polyphosphate kinase 2 family protein [Peptoniphilus sp. KCTC 25270]|uniref:polyphosphate kinase 2 family protein n=1 Tax=Peptoniphilus sp. KCTC 25270 TaxID=2897414 RepID=UPI001E3633EF|nr:polyphosphate kinase 2 family protein [Peptoniphilus sp. KCTC 25270]MCD1147664.1 polyphosphate kinase 2 family protein [Peptoniphilus sp. KCTC 25270]